MFGKRIGEVAQLPTLGHGKAAVTCKFAQFMQDFSNEGPFSAK
jgi:hypothetical protein